MANVTTSRVDSDLDAQSPAADLVRVYLNGIGKTALLTAADEVELAKRIEAGLYAQHLLETRKRLGENRKRDLAIIVRHILPQTASWVIISASLAIPLYTLTEAGLSFLGLGIQRPLISWGLLMQDAQKLDTLSVRQWIISPAGFIIAAVLGFNLLGDGLRDAADPYSNL